MVYAASGNRNRACSLARNRSATKPWPRDKMPRGRIELPTPTSSNSEQMWTISSSPTVNVKGSRALPYHLKDASTPFWDSLYAFSAACGTWLGIRDCRIPRFHPIFQSRLLGEAPKIQGSALPMSYLGIHKWTMDLLHNNIPAYFSKFRLQKVHRDLAYFSQYAIIPTHLFRSKFEKIITKAYCARGLMKIIVHLRQEFKSVAI